jgi:uncharacterized protein
MRKRTRTKQTINKTALVLAVLVLAAVLTGCSVNPGTAETQPITVNLNDDDTQINSVSVSATGTIKVMPDIAYVTAGVVTQNKKSAQAQSDNSEAMNALMSALKATGLTEDDIDTNGYSVYPMYDYSEDGNGKISAYEVTNTVRIAVRDLTCVGEIIDIAAESGANTNYSIEFTLEDEDAHYNEALTKAMEEAKGKADTLAAAGEFSIGGVLQVSEGSYSYSPMYEYAAADEAKADSATPVSAGELEVTATVTVVYSIF